MTAILLEALQHVPNLLRHIAINVVQDELGIADDGVQWSPEFMTHIGQKLGLVLTRSLKSMSLFLNFLE